MRPFALFHRRYLPRVNFVSGCCDLRLRCELCNVKKSPEKKCYMAAYRFAITLPGARGSLTVTI
jgi:hypothetical protein